MACSWLPSSIRIWARVAVGLTAAAALAQDVSLSPLQWSEARDAPDELPVLKSRVRIEFPAELRATPDLGYVVFQAAISSRSKLVALNPYATLEAFARVSVAPGQSWDFAAGRREGKPVNCAVNFAVVFNPASAAASGPEATPRLLEATVVSLPRPKAAKRDAVFAPRVVAAEVQLDEHGAITGVRHAPEELLQPIAIALKNWRFAPARQGGVPVAATVRVPFVLVTAGSPFAGKVTQTPQVIHQEPPIFPLPMRYSGMRGEVLVDFIVDIEGRVRNPYVVRSLNPAFDDPALAAVRKWRFEPGRVGEKPVPTHMQVPILFHLDDTRGGGSDGLTAAGKPDFSKLPEQFRYDTAPRLKSLVRPVYPYALLRDRKEGQAVVAYVVDAKGRVVRAEVKEASHPEFGRALLAAVEQFLYEPAIRGGRPGMALLAFKQEYRVDEAYQLVSGEDLTLLNREKKKPQSIVSLGELDQPLAPISRRPPQYPLADSGASGAVEVLVEFVVDEDGRARLPRVVKTTHESFGHAAASGVASWRFEPPTRGGRAVAVRVQVPFSFALAPPAPAK